MYRAGRKSEPFFHTFLAISSFNRVPMKLGGSLRKLLESKEHLDWLEIDLTVAKIITVQDYKHTKTEVNGRTQ